MVCIDFKEFETHKALIRTVLNSDRYYAYLCTGSAGLSKTTTTINELKQVLNETDYSYFNGYSTPLSLYKYLYENKDKKVICIDDADSIFNNPISISILKAILWDTDNKRIVYYNSTTDKLQDIPLSFEFNAKVILLLNDIPKKTLSSQALINRCIHYNLNLDFETKLKLCCEIIKQDEKLTEDQKNKAITILQQNITPATNDFSLRTVRKLLSFIETNQDTAETLLKATTTEDTDLKYYLLAIGSSRKVAEQIAYFNTATGHTGRMAFYRIKRTVSNVTGV